MKAITEACADASESLTTFPRVTGVQIVGISEPLILALTFMGMCPPVLACSLVIGATSEDAQLMLDEAGRQYRPSRELLSGKTEPDYARVIGVATCNALKRMELGLPGFVGIIPPMTVSLIPRVEPLGECLLAHSAPQHRRDLSSTTWAPSGTALRSSEEEGPHVLGISVAGASSPRRQRWGPTKDVAGPFVLIPMKLLRMTTL